MNLKHLNDHDLLKNTDGAVKLERKAITVVLHHFKEIERRRLYSAHKYGSLFEMAMKRYGYTENEAIYRISAIRLLQELPEIEEKIATGSLSLTHLNMARTHFRSEKKQTTHELTREEKLEVLKKMENTTKRESQNVLLSLSSAPQTLPRDEIRAITEDKVLLKFVADKSIEKEIEHLKGLLAHSAPGISLGELLKNSVS